MSTKLTKAQWQSHCKKAGIEFQSNDTISMLAVGMAATLGIKIAGKSDDEIKDLVIKGLEEPKAPVKASAKSSAKAPAQPKSKIGEMLSSVATLTAFIKAEKKILTGAKAHVKHTFLNNAEVNLAQVEHYLTTVKNLK